MAFEIGRRTLPDYASRFSRRDFSQPQLFTCLVLRQFHKTDYRGIVAILEDNPTLCEDLGMTKVPHFTTMQKAERKLLRDHNIREMLPQSVEIFFQLDSEADNKPRQAKAVEQAAADSSGFDLDRASRYFTRRKQKPRKTKGKTKSRSVTYRRFAKLGIIVCCAIHLILSIHRGMGPRPDTDELYPLMDNFVSNVMPEQLLADAGYDSEENHHMLRDYLDIDTIIPATSGRPTERLPTGKYRFLMQTQFDEENYGQRWQSETAFFMLKRHQGSSLKARTRWTRHREMGLMTVTHNVMIRC